MFWERLAGRHVAMGDGVSSVGRLFGSPPGRVCQLTRLQHSVGLYLGNEAAHGFPNSRAGYTACCGLTPLAAVELSETAHLQLTVAMWYVSLRSSATAVELAVDTNTRESYLADRKSTACWSSVTTDLRLSTIGFNVNSSSILVGKVMRVSTLVFSDVRQSRLASSDRERSGAGGDAPCDIPASLRESFPLICCQHA